MLPHRSLFLCLVSLLLLLACSNGGQVSIEEFSQAICESELKALSEETAPHQTWGQFRDDAQKAVDALESLPSPPPELQQYYSTTLEVWRAMVKMIERHPQEDLIRDHQLLSMMDEVAKLSESVDRAILAMPDDVFAKVTSVKC